MKKIYLKIILIFMTFIFIFLNMCYASEGFKEEQSEDVMQITKLSSTQQKSINEVISGADDFIKNANTQGTIDQSTTQATIDLIYNVLLAIGLVVAVICGVILGIQFMLSSADGQAEVKEKLIPYAVGCVVIFGAFGIWKLVMVLLKGF